MIFQFLAEAELVTARHEEQMRRMDRELREEQDLEFQRTMEADRVRMEELKKQKEEEELKLKMAEEKENMKIRRQTEHRVSYAYKANSLKIENKRYKAKSLKIEKNAIRPKG